MDFNSALTNARLTLPRNYMDYTRQETSAIKAVDTMSNPEALGYTLNSTFNMFRKSIFEQQMQGYSTEQITKEQMRSLISQEEDPYLRTSLINQSGEISSVSEYQARKQYLLTLRNAHEQVARNFNTAELLVYGAPFAILDADTIPLAIATEGLGVATKALSLTGKVSKIATAALVGGGANAANMYMYNKVTGASDTTSVQNAFWWGLGFGGTIGAVVSHVEKPGRVTVNTETGEVVPTARELKQQKYDAVRGEIARLDEALNIKSEIDKTISAHEKELNYALEKDSTKLQPVLKKVTEELNKKVEISAKTVENVKNIITKATEEHAATTSMFKETSKRIKELTKKLSNTVAIGDSANAIQTKLEELMLKKATLESKIKSIDLVSMGRSSLIKNQIVKNNETLAKQIKEIDKEIAQVNKEATKLSKKPLMTKAEKQELEALNLQLNAHKTKLESLSTSIQEAKNGLPTLLQDLKKNKTVKNTFDKNWHKTKIPLSEQTKVIMDKITKAKDYTKILQQKELLTNEEAKMLNGDFSLFNLKDMYVNQAQKLEKEMADMSTVIEKAELERLPIFKQVPSWFKNIVISPIEKLKNSPNRHVAALASLMHNGTLSMGKAITETADNVRKFLDARLKALHLDIEIAYKKDIADGLFEGSLSEYNAAISKERSLVLGKRQKEAFEGIPGGLSAKERHKIYLERLSVTTNKYSDSSRATLNQAVEAVDNYYKYIQERAKGSELYGFKNTISAGYTPHFYSLQAIEQMGREAAIEKLYTAQMKKASMFNENLDEAIQAHFRDIATKAIDKTLEKMDVTESIIKAFDEGIAGEEKALGTLETGVMKKRSIDVFDDDIIDLIEHEATLTSSAYGLKMHGRIALKERLGVNNSKEFNDLINSIGATPKERENFVIIGDTILGRREIATNPLSPLNQITKGISSISSIMHMGAFGLSTVTEITALQKEFGFDRIMKHFTQGIADLNDVYKHGSAADKNQIKLLHSYGEAYMSYRANRYDAEGILDSVTGLQNFLDKSVHKMSFWSGIGHVTDFFKLMSTTLTTDFVARASVKELSNTDYMRLLDMGFEKSDLAEIRKVLQVDENGNINNWDRTTWGKLDDKLTYAGITTIDRTILHPSGATLPALMTDYSGGAFVPRIFAKFLRFPVESYERLLLRGLQQFDAKQSAALATNTAMWYFILKAKDALREDDKKYYTDANQYNIYRDSVLANSALSFPILAADKAYSFATGKTLAGYPATIAAPFTDINKLRQGHVTVAVPFYNINVGNAASNIINQSDYLKELSEAMPWEK